MRPAVMTLLSVLSFSVSAPAFALAPPTRAARPARTFEIVVQVDRKEPAPGRTCATVHACVGEGTTGEVITSRNASWGIVGSGELNERSFFLGRLEVVAWGKDSVRLDLAAAPKWNEDVDGDEAVIRGAFVRNSRWFKFGKSERIFFAWDRRGAPLCWFEVTVTERAPE